MRGRRPALLAGSLGAGRLIRKPECRHCKRTEHLVRGDGPAVCFPCIGVLTEAAADPSAVSKTLRDELMKRHALTLALTENAKGQPEWALL